MEDVTDPAFRLMCKKFGADMVYTEFVSSDALIRAVNKTAQKLSISDEERPVAIQIYGKDTETMVEAAKIVEQAQPDILDINFGCPVKRVAAVSYTHLDVYKRQLYTCSKDKPSTVFAFSSIFCGVSIRLKQATALRPSANGFTQIS